MGNFSLTQLKGKLIVSCQALDDEPLHSSFIMGKMALAAYQGGAGGIRANGYQDIMAIKKEVPLPVIGIFKKVYQDSQVFITPTMSEVDEVVKAGADMIAIDATSRVRPHNSDLETLINNIKFKYEHLPVMADVSTLEEAKNAEKLGFNCVSTTLIGYTEETKGQKLYANDFNLLKEIIKEVNIPVISEGNVLTPEMAKCCLELGSFAVVVGGAITRPQQITERFMAIMN